MTCWWWSRDSTGWWWRFCFLQKICWHFWDVLFLSKTVLLWSFNKFCYCWSPAQRRAREKKETWKWKIFMFLRYCLYCESAERHRKHSSIMKVNFTNPLKTPETNTSPTTSQQFLLSKTLFGVFFFFVSWDSGPADKSEVLLSSHSSTWNTAGCRKVIFKNSKRL